MRRHHLQQKIIGALVHPIAVITIAGCILAFTMIFIIPKFEQMFKEMELGDLPAMTKLLLLMANTMVNYWYILIFLPVLACVGLKFIVKTPPTSLLLPLAVLLLAAEGVCGEPSGGRGDGANRAETAGGAARPAAAANTLPWPAPDAKVMEKMKAELREQFPATFQIIPVGPWVVATDLDKESAPRFTDYTITRYAAAIQRQLFTKTPRSEPVKVLLFADKTSYEAWNQKLYGEKPHTPFGYYSRQRKAMVMNIGTGGGTLLHEMVHAMAEADYPDIAAWLNEGVGSLFEASNSTRSGKVIGVTNWRLTGLQDDLAKSKAPKFKDLLAMGDMDFYGDRSSSNYAAARYLMQYLQEQGKLEAFYTRIRDKKDADALTTLRGVFDDKLTVEQIEEACYAWVKTLRLSPR
ncbi:MAG: hypothetical protein NTW87_03970 [Planctomycetota bacterium]|nr:hypothetical protein [Planctomycetota bacterium]